MYVDDLKKKKLGEIIENLLDNQHSWLQDKGIIVSPKAGYWMLNYCHGPRTDYNRLVRGMVVRRPLRRDDVDPLKIIDSFPFIRFFNHGESEADHVDFSNAHMVEKLDGCLVGVFFPKWDYKQPLWHTRKMLSSDPVDYDKSITTFHGKNYKFLPIIGEYVKKLNFNADDLPFTYMFEFIHDASFVWTKYTEEQWGLYLIGGRDLRNYYELTESELDEAADRIGAKRPKLWNALTDMDEIAQMMKKVGEEIPDFEGFVFRDKGTGHRIKMKVYDYILKHRMLDKSRSTRHMLQLVLQGETEEITAYFPHLGERMHEIREAYDKYVDMLVDKILFWQSKNLSKKELACDLLGYSPTKGGSKRKAKEPKYVCVEIMRLYDVKRPDVLRESVDGALLNRAMASSKGALAVLETIGMRNEEQEDMGDI